MFGGAQATCLSGCCSDPVTKAWLEGAQDPVMGFPGLVRFSWQPVGRAMEERGPKVQWCVQRRCVVDDQGFKDLTSHTRSSPPCNRMAKQKARQTNCLEHSLFSFNA